MMTILTLLFVTRNEIKKALNLLFWFLLLWISLQISFMIFWHMWETAMERNH